MNPERQKQRKWGSFSVFLLWFWLKSLGVKGTFSFASVVLHLLLLFSQDRNSIWLMSGPPKSTIGRPVPCTQPLVHHWYTQQLQSNLSIPVDDSTLSCAGSLRCSEIGELEMVQPPFQGKPCLFQQDKPHSAHITAGAELTRLLSSDSLPIKLWMVQDHRYPSGHLDPVFYQFPESEPDMEKLHSASMLHMSGKTPRKPQISWNTQCS